MLSYIRPAFWKFGAIWDYGWLSWSLYNAARQFIFQRASPASPVNPTDTTPVELGLSCKMILMMIMMLFSSQIIIPQLLEEHLGQASSRRGEVTPWQGECREARNPQEGKKKNQLTSVFSAALEHPSCCPGTQYITWWAHRRGGGLGISTLDQLFFRML